MQAFNAELRVKAEGSGIVLKSIATVAVLSYDRYSLRSKSSEQLGLLAFGFGQVIYSITLLLVYLAEYSSTLSFVFRRPAEKRPGSPG